MAITGMVHFNVNCSDYDRSLEFYNALGLSSGGYRRPTLRKWPRPWACRLIA